MKSNNFMGLVTSIGQDAVNNCSVKIVSYMQSTAMFKMFLPIVHVLIGSVTLYDRRLKMHE